MVRRYKQKLGSWGEDLAARFLVQKGYRVVQRNFRVKVGEIDLICRKAEALVFVEVKTRTSRSHGLAEEAINWRKRQRLARAIEAYLQRNGTHADIRFDVVVVEVFGPRPNIIHYENIALV